MNINDVARDILDRPVMLAISDARCDPRKELGNSVLMISFCLGQLCARDFNVEILRSSETERSRQINRLRGVGRFLCQDC